MTRGCCWIHRPCSIGIEAIYCGKPVRYTMTKDDDGNRVRKYNHFCDEHEPLAKKQEEEEENGAQG